LREGAPIKRKPKTPEDELITQWLANGGKIKSYEVVPVRKFLTTEERKRIVGASTKNKNEILWLGDAPVFIDTYETKVKIV
jgi:hypothetical protein